MQRYNASARKYETFEISAAELGHAIEGYVSYTDIGLTPGATYYYRVLPFADTGSGRINGLLSDKKSAKPLPSAPGGLQAVKASETSANLSWAAVDGAVKYEIYRAAQPKGPYTKLTTTMFTRAVSTGLSAGKTYYYMVRAYTLAGAVKVYGGYSEIAVFDDLNTDD